MRTAAGTSLNLLFISTISAASIAISVPAPMAIPTSARVRAGASLIPSPTIATFPSSFNFLITSSFPSGKTPAITSSTPACSPIAFAVRSLSPVSMTTLIPIFFNSLTACGLFSFIMSATAIMPISSSFLPKNNGVFPSDAKLSACFLTASEITVLPSANFKFPPKNLSPPISPVKPFPETAVKFFASSFVWIASSSAFFKIACANGCSLFFSRMYAYVRSSDSLKAEPGKISVTVGLPFVIVPVLSSTTTSIFPVSSRETAVLNKIPFFAPTPFPTIIATGVARPRAQGQLITRTEIPRARAKPIVSPNASHTIIVKTATAITTGTNTPDTLSATFAIGAFVAAASPTIWII